MGTHAVAEIFLRGKAKWLAYTISCMVFFLIFSPGFGLCYEIEPWQSISVDGLPVNLELIKTNGSPNLDGFPITQYNYSFIEALTTSNFANERLASLLLSQRYVFAGETFSIFNTYDHYRTRGFDGQDIVYENKLDWSGINVEFAVPDIFRHQLFAELFLFPIWIPGTPIPSSLLDTNRRVGIYKDFLLELVTQIDYEQRQNPDDLFDLLKSFIDFPALEKTPELLDFANKIASSGTVRFVIHPADKNKFLQIWGPIKDQWPAFGECLSATGDRLFVAEEAFTITTDIAKQMFVNNLLLLPVIKDRVDALLWVADNYSDSMDPALVEAIYQLYDEIVIDPHGFMESHFLALEYWAANGQGIVSTWVNYTTKIANWLLPELSSMSFWFVLLDVVVEFAGMQDVAQKACLASTMDMYLADVAQTIYDENQVQDPDFYRAQMITNLVVSRYYSQYMYYDKLIELYDGEGGVVELAASIIRSLGWDINQYLTNLATAQGIIFNKFDEFVVARSDTYIYWPSETYDYLPDLVKADFPDVYCDEDSIVLDLIDESVNISANFVQGHSFLGEQFRTVCDIKILATSDNENWIEASSGTVDFPIGTVETEYQDVWDISDLPEDNYNVRFIVSNCEPTDQNYLNDIVEIAFQLGAEGPVLADFLPVYLAPGTSTTINLDDHLLAPPDADDVEWTATGYSNLEVSLVLQGNDRIANIVAPPDWVSNEHIVFRATDTTGLYAEKVQNVYSSGGEFSLLANGAVSPAQGSIYTDFSFNVVYSNTLGNPPDQATVVINGFTYAMEPGTGSFSSGKTYTYARRLGIGDHHKYYFVFRRGAQQIRLPESGYYYGPEVDDHQYLVSGSVSPTDGDELTQFSYRVRYINPNGDAPYLLKVIIDGTHNTMHKISGTYQNGEYEFKTTLGYGDHTYRFAYMSDPYTIQYLPEEGSDPFEGPYVSNSSDISLEVQLVSTQIQPGDHPIFRVIAKDYLGSPIDLDPAPPSSYQLWTFVNPPEFYPTMNVNRISQGYYECTFPAFVVGQGYYTFTFSGQKTGFIVTDRQIVVKSPYNMPDKTQVEITNVYTLPEIFNPAQGDLEIHFTLENQSAKTTIIIESETGEELAVLLNKELLSPGDHVEYWDGRDTSGIIVSDPNVFVIIRAMFIDQNPIITRFGPYGTGYGKLLNPWGINIPKINGSYESELYVSDPARQRILKYSISTTSFTSEFGSPNNCDSHQSGYICAPRGIVRDSSRYMYIWDYVHPSAWIQKFDENYQNGVGMIINPVNESPFDIEISDDFTIYMTGGSRIYKMLPPNYGVSQSATVGSNLYGIGVDYEGNIWTVDADKLYKLSATNFEKIFECNLVHQGQGSTNISIRDGQLLYVRDWEHMHVYDLDCEHQYSIYLGIPHGGMHTAINALDSGAVFTTGTGGGNALVKIDDKSNVDNASKKVIIDSIVPTAQISSPSGGVISTPLIPIVGTAYDDNIFLFNLEYGYGSNPTSWQSILTGRQNIENSLLGTADLAISPSGNYTIRLTVYDYTGGSSVDSVTIEYHDSIAPTSNIVSPATGARLNGTIQLLATTPDSDVTGIEFQYEEAGSGIWQTLGTGATPPFTKSWNTTGLTSGDYNIRSIATDFGGNVETTPTFITVSIDNEGPAAAMTGPANGQQVMGQVNLSASCSAPDCAAVKFQYKSAGGYNWIDVGGPDTTPPYQTTWNASHLSAGDYNLRAVGYDDLGNFDQNPASITVGIAADTNSNNVADPWEEQWFGRLLEPGEELEDPDGDGLTTIEEYEYSDQYPCLDPQALDSDGDCVSDGDEIDDGFDPCDPADQLPVADAGTDQTLDPVVVELDGCASYDPNSDPLTYTWTQESGSPVTLITEDCYAYFYGVSGEYSFSLVVNDGLCDSETDVVSVSINDVEPDAAARAAGNALAGETLRLDGSDTLDLNREQLIYLWQIVSAPGGSSPVLEWIDQPYAYFTPDLAGDYLIELTGAAITDRAEIKSSSSNIGIHVVDQNSLPVADAGLSIYALTNESYILDGRNSYDPQEELLTYSWSLDSKPAGSLAAIQNANQVIATIEPDLAGDYVISLEVTNAFGQSDPSTIILSASDDNLPPNANAGVDQSVLLGASVTLSGTRTNDPNGDAIQYEWWFTHTPDGSFAVLTNPGTVCPSFVTDLEGLYTISLFASDPLLTYGIDNVVVYSLSGNGVPIANAGDDQPITAGDEVTLDGTGSHDPDGDALTYNWAFIAMPLGSSAELDDSASPTPSFIADQDGYYVLSLRVDDGQFESERSMVVIHAGDNAKPIADAGEDQSGEVDDPITLDGSGSSDPDGDAITYEWSIVTAPSGSTAQLQNAQNVLASITPDLVGEYLIQLIVTDEHSLDSNPDEVELTITESTDDDDDTTDDDTTDDDVTDDDVTDDDASDDDMDDDVGDDDADDDLDDDAGDDDNGASSRPGEDGNDGGCGC